MNLHAELVCRADSAEEFARLARIWLVEAATERFPELVRGLPSGRVLRRQTNQDPFGVIGPPNATWATVHVQSKPSSFGGSNSPYFERTWRKLLDGLDGTYPFDVAVNMTPLDAEGKAVDRYAAAVVGVRRHRNDPRWVQLYMTATSHFNPWSGSSEWVAFMENWADRVDAGYGHLTDDADVLVGTALEMATYRIGLDQPTIPRCRELLRGYSWVTVCAPELVQRLGDLAASGAFYLVRELPGGQVLLQATPTLEQFEGAALERVFRALAPVLLPGRVTAERTWPGARLVVGVDAADYQ